MEIIAVIVAITLAVIILVVYGIFVVSNRQKRLANRAWEENRFIRAPYNTGRFAFETSEELTSGNEKNKPETIFEDM